MSEKPTYEDLERRIQELEETIYLRNKFLDDIPDYIIVQDSKQIIWANRAAADSVGKKIEDIVGRHCYEIWQQRTEPCEECPILKTIKTGKPEERDTFTPYGRTYHIRGCPMRDKKGRIVGAFEYGFDITELKQAEEALKKSQKNYRLLIENQNDLVVHADSMQRIIYVSPSYCNTFGKSENELVGQYFKPLIHPEDLDHVTDSLASLINPPHATCFEERDRTVDGWRWFSWSVKAIIGGDGDISEFFSIGRDITDYKRSEIEKEQLLSQLQATLEATVDGIIVFGLDEKIKVFSKRFQKLWNMPDSVLKSKDANQALAYLSDIVNEPELFSQKMQTSLTDSNANTFDKLYLKDGRVFESYSRPQKINDKMIGRVWGFRDVTDRHRMEKALRKSEELLDTVMNGVSIFVTYIDREQRYVFVNHAYAKWYGKSREELLGKRVSDVLSPEIYERTSCNIETALSGQRVSCTNTVLDQDGTQRHFSANYDPHYSCGEVKGFFATLFDITERKQAEEALRKTEQQLRFVLDNVPVLIWQKDCDGTYMQVNKTFCETHGRLEKEILGKTDHDIFTRELADQYVAVDHRVLAARTPEFSIEERLQKTSGTLGWSRKDKLPYFDDEGNVAGTIGFAVDITEMKRAEEQVRHLIKAESMGRLAGAIAHHFNNQLCVVLGNLELAKDNLPGDAATRAYLDEAITATRRSSEISGQLLTYLGQGTGSCEPMDLSDVCSKNAPMLQNIIPNNIAVEVSLPAAGPVVVANPNMMLQVLTHLIINGIEAIGDRKGKLDLAVKTILSSAIPKANIVPIDWKPGADIYACLELTDTGRGIAEQDMEKVFDPFFTTKFTGRGIGLALVQGIVKSWKGAITVESAKNCGSTFRIFLPIVIDTASMKPERRTGAPILEKTGTVLLVEDQEPVRKMAETMIKSLGFSVLAAAGGAEALELFRRHQRVIRCVITDLTMPHMDGWETMSALRKMQPGLRVILASGYDEAQAMNRDSLDQPQFFLKKALLECDGVDHPLDVPGGDEAVKIGAVAHLADLWQTVFGPSA